MGGVKLINTRLTLRLTNRDPWRRFRAGLGVFALILVVGSCGYIILGSEPLEALYQTVITVTTVGYREVGEVTREYIMFTIVLILCGAGTSLYLLGVVMSTMFDGRLDDHFRRQNMQKEIDRLSGHVVLCGYGRAGRAIEGELIRAGHEVVSIDRREPENFRQIDDHWVVIGDATDDHTLLEAGLDRAATLVVALNSDVDNLFITLNAQTINPDLFIVARANRSAVEPRLHRAGADRVVNPNQIGGTRMAALVSHPEVMKFLDVVTRDREFKVRLTEIGIAAGSEFADRSLAECDIRSTTGVNVLAVRRAGSYTPNPSRDFVLRPEDLLICLGTAEQIAVFGARAGIR